MDWISIFQKHIDIRCKVASDALQALSMDGLVLGAGTSTYYFQDDQAMFFRPSHHFAHFCPVLGENHFVVVRPGEKPDLYFFHPDDFWHDHEPLGNPIWADAFNITTFKTSESIWAEVAKLKGFAYIGPETSLAEEAGLSAGDSLESYLNWHRCYKTDYEIQCIDRATEIAARGHRAAKEAFFEGASEYMIHQRYLQACQVTDFELPYNGIVALNEKSAVLHYQNKRAYADKGQVLLIDSGAQYNGYASDITRTYASSDAPSIFQSMCRSMNTEQIKLCGMVRPQMDFSELHYASHLAVANILLEHGILQGLSVEEAYTEGVTRVFYPHGVGHMLGLLVHDVGGKQKNPEGEALEKNPDHPNLRALRPLESNFVFTIEPGLYFIPMLLEDARNKELNRYLNWDIIEAMIPCGGIRVEDNVLVTADSTKNITRQYLT